MYFYYVCTVHFWSSCGRHAHTFTDRIILYTYTVYTYTCTYSYKVYKQINILLLAIPSGMKIIFQPSCFHTLRNIPSFVRRIKQENEDMMMILTNKQKYVSQLPLANKSILSQGHFVSSVFVDHLSVDIMLDQYEVKCNLKLFNITNTSLS